MFIRLMVYLCEVTARHKTPHSPLFNPHYT